MIKHANHFSNQIVTLIVVYFCNQLLKFVNFIGFYRAVLRVFHTNFLGAYLDRKHIICASIGQYALKKHHILSFFIIIGSFLGQIAYAGREHPENWYQQRYCEGESEVVLSDRTRVDCLTPTHAIEFDFGNKWSEAVGQSLGYAFETNRRAGIYLILESQDDYKYWIKLNSIVDHYKLPIDTWKIGFNQ